MTGFDAFLDNLLTRGLEYLGKFYTPCRAFVTRNDDPEQRGRVQIHCPRVGHSGPVDTWVDPAFLGAGNDRGFFWPPEVGDTVWVTFTNGDPRKPATYTGGWHGKEDLPDEFEYSSQNVKIPAGPTQNRLVPERRGFITRKGQRLVFSDESGEESVELSWHRPKASDPSITAEVQGTRSGTPARTGETSQLLIDSKGDITISNHVGSKVSLRNSPEVIEITDTSGNVITLKDGQVTVKAATAITLDAGSVMISTGADTPAVRGSNLIQYLATHNHGTPWGPTTPPLVPPPASILSTQVKVK